ncbi:hypothetical protein BKA70DRAFT_1223931 [Coprinopsis sp. MPI-PUGE-AT-0042]|nr:hypothetical protein BKA70DRAFT_1223931 [Coprinopsis sp. MPI-PUGE-AT-0042]
MAQGSMDQTQADQHDQQGINQNLPPSFTIHFTVPANPSCDEMINFNTLLAQARTRGETGVPEDFVIPQVRRQRVRTDEEEEDVPSTDDERDDEDSPPPKAEGPKRKRRDDDISAVIGAIQSFSPRTQKRFAKTFIKDVEGQDGSSKPSPTPVIPPQFILSSSADMPSVEFMDSEVTFDPAYAETMRLRYYLPLTAFSLNVLKDAAFCPDFKYVNVYCNVFSTSDPSGKDKDKDRVLDPKQFPDEKKMTLAQFHECYHYFLEFLSKYRDSNTHKRFHTHYSIITTRGQTTTNFEDVLEVDIWYRNLYLKTRAPHPQFEYNLKLAHLESMGLQAPKFKSLQDQIATQQAQLNEAVSNGFVPGSSGSGGRGTALPGVEVVVNGGARGGRQSFQENLPPLCLICRGAHAFADCNADKTIDGKTTPSPKRTLTPLDSPIAPPAPTSLLFLEHLSSSMHPQPQPTLTSASSAAVNTTPCRGTCLDA